MRYYPTFIIATIVSDGKEREREREKESKDEALLIALKLLSITRLLRVRETERNEAEKKLRI